MSSEERKKQLRHCLEVLRDGPEDTNMLLAGDLSIRDFEVGDTVKFTFMIILYPE